MNKKNKGFTLIELLIVIAVIAILVAIVIPNFRGIRIQAKQAAAMADLRNLQTACAVYMKFHNVNPGTLDQLTLEHKTKRIVDKIPFDPFKENTQYGYQTEPAAGENSTYVIWSVGPDGEGAMTVGDDTVSGITLTGADNIYVTNAKEAS